MGTLYVVATPIGNLEDMTLRALRVLKDVALIAAEDTRHTRKLVAHYGIATPLLSYHRMNERSRISTLLERLEQGDVALVSDAGTPAVSDPGAALVRAAISARHRVVPIPGASAVLAALIASGLPTDRFTFVGFLPRRAAERRTALERLAAESGTLILFEAPHRLRATLSDALATLGNRPAVAARELTKVHEEFVRGDLRTLIAHFTANPPRGELTLIVGGAAVSPSPEPVISPRAALDEALARGLRPRAAAAEASRRTGVPARELYGLLIAKRPSASIE